MRGGRSGSPVRRLLPCVIAAAIVGAPFLAAPPAAAAKAPTTVTYTQEALGIPDVSEVADVNDFDIVVGTAGGRAFRWAADGGPQLLPLLAGATASEAKAINETGQIVGSMTTSSGTQAVLWDSALQPTALDAPGYVDSAAVDINNRGQIAGFATRSADGDLRALRWDGLGASIVALTDPPLISEDDELTGPFPTAINDAGWVVGIYFLSAGNCFGRGILWDQTGALARHDFNCGGLHDLNDASTIAGDTADEADQPHAFIVRSIGGGWEAQFPTGESRIDEPTSSVEATTGERRFRAVGWFGGCSDVGCTPVTWQRDASYEALTEDAGQAQSIAETGTIAGWVGGPGQPHAAVRWVPSVGARFARFAEIEQGTAVGGGVASMTKDDPLSLDVTSTGDAPTTDWSATFNAVQNSASSLTVTYEGRSSAPCRQDLFVFNWDAGHWNRIDRRDASTTDDTVTETLNGNLARYVSGDVATGDVRVRVTCTEATDAFTTSADLLELEVGS